MLASRIANKQAGEWGNREYYLNYRGYQLRRTFASATLAQQRDARPGRDAPAAGSAAVCGHTYQLPPGQSAQTFFTGSLHFQAAEVEVYQVQLQ